MTLLTFPPLELIPFLDGSFITGVATGLLVVAKFIYDLKVEQERLKRDVYGADDNETRPGLLANQQRQYRRIEERLERMESKIDENDRDVAQTRQLIESIAAVLDTSPEFEHLNTTVDYESDCETDD